MTDLVKRLRTVARERLPIATEAAAALEAKDAEIARLREALTRQGDNMAFVLNHVSLPDQYFTKFTAELERDRAALQAKE
jgi:hypothetical protein